ncbi:hypothetical protein L1987_13167 [Smallanthus sonchifolius]|uniref:Uncharacterized protein n=1 Tax=Smallanthus sonchifolius TaxID=185202 RepID=A0ACB9JFT1_9ASTR|nr:hypothetical protein L1987_13167 [Smallanthus sonchifolius]
MHLFEATKKSIKVGLKDNEALNAKKNSDLKRNLAETGQSTTKQGSGEVERGVLVVALTTGITNLYGVEHKAYYSKFKDKHFRRRRACCISGHRPFTTPDDGDPIVLDDATPIRSTSEYKWVNWVGYEPGSK